MAAMLIDCWKQTADLRENIANEIKSAEESYLKLDAHISSYMTEMDRFL